MDEPEEYIDFMAKYGSWIAIKRLGIDGSTKPEEVVQHLAIVRNTIDGKSFLLMGIKTDALDAYSKRVSSGSRKSYSSLSSAISRLDGAETKRIISESCSKELAPLAEIYLLSRIITDIGYDTAINQNVMAKIFPDLKVKKPLGRGKGKKED